ncbi:MAG: energy transducer TonB [Bacteroidales bacterium]|nr:energy transducer TonB [Bacteroidales bacterium]MBP5758256.1 energy transducer TonB [Bacteroidales bacterium]
MRKIALALLSLGFLVAVSCGGGNTAVPSNNSEPQDAELDSLLVESLLKCDTSGYLDLKGIDLVIVPNDSNTQTGFFDVLDVQERYSKTGMRQCVSIKERNVFTIAIGGTKSDKVQLDGKTYGGTTEERCRLKLQIKDFLDNNNNLDSLPEKFAVDYGGLKYFNCSKGVVLLRCETNADTHVVGSLLRVVRDVVQEIRDSVSKVMFGVPLHQLGSGEKLMLLSDAVPYAVAVERHFDTTNLDVLIFRASETDRLPEFPGGDDALFNYLKKNLGYPQKAKDNKTEGKVFVEFVVGRDGTITHPEILRPLGDGCSEEALRLVREMPKWEPGRKQGYPVRVQFVLPVYFQLPD